MTSLVGSSAELHFTVSVKSGTTGEVKTYDMVGFADEEQLKALQAEGLLPAAPTEKDK